jgi:hypothetical protein
MMVMMVVAVMVMTHIQQLLAGSAVDGRASFIWPHEHTSNL